MKVTKILLLAVLLFVGCDMRPVPDFIKGGKGYQIHTPCVRDSIWSEMVYGPTLGPTIGDYRMGTYRFGFHMETKRQCLERRIDTIELKEFRVVHEK